MILTPFQFEDKLREIERLTVELLVIPPNTAEFGQVAYRRSEVYKELRRTYLELHDEWAKRNIGSF